MHSFFTTLLFLVVTGLLFFVPGYLLLRILRMKILFNTFEVFLFSFALSIGLLDFLMILLGKAGIPFTRVALFFGITGSILLLALASRVWQHFYKNLSAKNTPVTSHSLLHFSKHQTQLFLFLLLLTFGIKTAYLSQAVVPTATDLGHHMYWSKLIAETGKLPFYGKREIIPDEGGRTVLSSNPTPIADFIVGEHLPFAALNIFSRIDFFSAFPVIFLFLINLLSVLALFVLTLRLASSIKSPFLSHDLFTPQNIALGALLFFGPLYTLASPEEKFVSGGVVGNVFGNLFIPLIILIYYRAFKEKRGSLFGLALFLTFTLAYIHHLSTLVLLLVLIFSAVLYLFFHLSTLGTVFRSWKKLFLAPAPLFVLVFTCLFFFLVAMPTYIETHAVGTVLGTPTKTTRTGLSFLQITSSSGEARVAFGLAGLILLLLLVTRKRYASVFLLGWGIVLSIMTLHPEWLFINIPSNRIGAYLSFPLGILAAFSLMAYLACAKEHGKQLFLPGILFLVMLFSGLNFAFGSGSFDNSQTLLPESKSSSALETFRASAYLEKHNRPADIILKDHNYIVADSWMKLFFLRDYSYPLSRGYFKRYEDNPEREQCTLLMISVPNTPRGQKCYDDTGTNLVVVSTHFDATQFEKSPRFSRIYQSADIDIFERH